MDQHAIFLLLGLANGAVYAALALTLVVTYRSSGVVNFATGTMALLGAYTYAFLRQGEVMIPLPWVPERIEIPVELGFWPAALISVAVCTLTGLLLYLLVFRPARSAPPLAKAVASIGVMLVFTGRVPDPGRPDGCPDRPDPAEWGVDARRGADLPGPGVLRTHHRGNHVLAGSGLPVHAIRSRHPCGGGDREGRVRQRHRARSRRRRQLDDQRSDRRRSPAC